eukprot:6477249-Amphidinium_carterae.1
MLNYAYSHCITLTCTLVRVRRSDYRQRGPPYNVERFAVWCDMFGHEVYKYVHDSSHLPGPELRKLVVDAIGEERTKVMPVIKSLKLIC